MRLLGMLLIERLRSLSCPLHFLPALVVATSRYVYNALTARINLQYERRRLILRDNNNLKLREVRIDDRGEWQCVVNNRHGNVTRTFIVEILGVFRRLISYRGRSCSLEYFRFIFAPTSDHFCKRKSTQVSRIHRSIHVHKSCAV